MSNDVTLPLSVQHFLAAAIATFVLLYFLFPALLLIARLFSLYTIVKECQAKVYVLFGRVLAVIDEP